MDTMLSRLLQYWRLRGTRLRRLMARRHVDVALYLRSTAPARVRAQVEACRRCDSAARCERALQSLAAGTSGYRFCPNRGADEPFFDSAGIRFRPRWPR